MAKVGLPMPPVCFIVARSHGDNVIGREGKLPWTLRTDLRRFRSLTTNHAVIMGRKTYESIGKPLPDRLNVVVSRTGVGQRSFVDLRGIRTRLMQSNSAEDALFCSDVYTILNDARRIFVIGGAEIYRRFADIVDRVYLTEVYADLNGDAVFEQDFSADDWRISHREDVSRSDADEFDSTFLIIDRRKSARRLRAFDAPSTARGTSLACTRSIDGDDARLTDGEPRDDGAPTSQLDFGFG